MPIGRGDTVVDSQTSTPADAEPRCRWHEVNDLLDGNQAHRALDLAHQLLKAAVRREDARAKEQGRAPSMVDLPFSEAAKRALGRLGPTLIWGPALLGLVIKAGGGK